MATSQSKAVMISDEVMAKVRKSMPWLPATGLDRIRACVFEVVAVYFPPELENSGMPFEGFFDRHEP